MSLTGRVLFYSVQALDLVPSTAVKTKAPATPKADSGHGDTVLLSSTRETEAGRCPDLSQHQLCIN